MSGKVSTLTAVCLIILLAAAPATTRQSDEAQIKEAAHSVVDTSAASGVSAVDAMVIRSDVERRFATALVSSHRAEFSMFRRAAVAATGSEKSLAATLYAAPIKSQLAGIDLGKVAVKSDTAELTFDSSVRNATAFHFQRLAGIWKCDFLRTYRDRQQIDAQHIAILNERVRAADHVARMYEAKEVKDLTALETLYATIYEYEAQMDKEHSTQSTTAKPQ